jgi:hypothetical protein
LDLIPVLDTLGNVKGMKVAVGKVLQNLNDFKNLWDYFSRECGENIKVRKLKPNELSYYWSVISFDIAEPIFIIESESHKYLIDMGEKGNIIWLDEVW